MRGGKRTGAGRPSGTNQYGETTKPVRIPISKIEQVMAYIKEDNLRYAIPLYSNKISAGFPTLTSDDVECTLDLNAHLVKNPSATFCVVVSGDSMQNAGIISGDMLIVDRSIEPVHGKVIIASIEGELTVKRLSTQRGRIQLMPENRKYQPIDITDAQDIIVLGVVTHVIHEVL